MRKDVKKDTLSDQYAKEKGELLAHMRGAQSRER